MPTTLQPFKYGVSHKIIYWGCVFDSLLELKYAISIRDEYAFLRSHIPIYFNPTDHQPTNYIRENIRRYTPDFLIRHKTTNQAWLVEIKPRAFAGDRQLVKRQAIAENYIRWKGYDWQYKVVFDNEIQLTAAQLDEFRQSRNLICKSARKLQFEKYNKLFDRSAPSFYTKAPDTRQVRFVMFGTAKESNFFRP